MLAIYKDIKGTKNERIKTMNTITTSTIEQAIRDQWNNADHGKFPTFRFFLLNGFILDDQDSIDLGIECVKVSRRLYLIACGDDYFEFMA